MIYDEDIHETRLRIAEAATHKGNVPPARNYSFGARNRKARLSHPSSRSHSSSVWR
jgi:hypothetical protein